MKIMFAAATYWPAQDGVAIITEQLAEEFARRGHEVFVLTSVKVSGLQEFPEQEEHEGVSIARMRIYVRWPLTMKGLDEKSSQKAYIESVRTYKPDVLFIECAQTWTLDWIKPYLSELKCIKIFHCHGYSALKENVPYRKLLLKRNVLGCLIEYKRRKYFKELYEYIGQFDLAIYLTQESNSTAYAEQYKLENGLILENPVDERFFADNMRHQYERLENGELVRYLFVANYNANKNQEMLINAFSQAKIGKSQLVFVGYEENEYYNFLVQLGRAALEGQPNKDIKFYTHIRREDVLELYRKSDVFVCSSKSETWSVVAHEAAATAMPIISTNVGIYSGISGVYIAENCAEMAKAMERLYNAPIERKRRGIAAYEWVLGQDCKVKDKVDVIEKRIAHLKR